MKTYGLGNTPYVNPPSGDYYFVGANSYTPVNMEPLEEKLQRYLKKLEGEMTELYPKMKSLLEDLEIDFGENFIKINDKALGFVDSEAFLKLLNDLQSVFDNTQTDTNKFFGDCSEGNANINEWLELLEKNRVAYEEALQRYNNARNAYVYAINNDDNDANIYQLQREMDQAKVEKDKYKSLPGVPNSSEYGYWITKGGR